MAELRVKRDTRKQMDARKAELLADLEGLQYLNRGLAGIIRYRENRAGISELNQSVSEHVVGILNLAEYFENNVKQRYELDWNKIQRMIRLHDIGEIETGDIISPEKTQLDNENELVTLDSILEKLPHVFRSNLIELVTEKEEQVTPEGRFVHLLDKLEAKITIATQGGLEALKTRDRQDGRNSANFNKQANLMGIHLAYEWGFPEIAEFWEVVWQRQIELGILKQDDSEKDREIQLKFEF